MHNDLQNLLAATEFDALFLDSNLRIARFTDRMTERFGVTQTDAGQPIDAFAGQLEDADLVNDARTVLTDLVPVQREIRSRRGRWYDMRVRPYRTVDDAIDGVIVIFIDVTARRATERRLQLLLGELTHRVRNTLAVVQAIARHTMRNSRSKDDFAERFEARLSALAGAHNLLVSSDWKGADFAELVRRQVAPYTTNNPERLRLHGPSLSLPVDLATPVGLVLHELASNAAECGSLSVPAGAVSLRWSTAIKDLQRILVVAWQENGGPPAAQSRLDGLGSALIDRVIPGAHVAREFRPEGFLCTIELVLPELREDASDSS
jgi:two-component system CheB/CheR fusion protein